ncbi:type II toxin-antitoxin system VapC family toxin [bacterium]|nr:type II toxin-antitoxin system VapC family toxin [bacterium]MCI0601420.1 type II toxin-antitoxin system VapC family toxin [bacterium]
MKFLLDTNILSEPLKAIPNPKTLKKLHAHQGEIATATPVWHEMLFGCWRLPSSVKRRNIEDYLSNVVWPSVPILSYDTTAAEWHASERARLTLIGKAPRFVDGQIAAIARTNDLILVTGNIKDFALFAELHVENWL